MNTISSGVVFASVSSAAEGALSRVSDSVVDAAGPLDVDESLLVRTGGAIEVDRLVVTSQAGMLQYSQRVVGSVV